MNIKIWTEDSSLELDFTAKEARELLEIDLIYDIVADTADMFLDILESELINRIQGFEVSCSPLSFKELFGEYMDEENDDDNDDDNDGEVAFSFTNSSKINDVPAEDGEVVRGIDDDGDDVFEEAKDFLRDLMYEAGLSKETIEDILDGVSGISKF